MWDCYSSKRQCDLLIPNWWRSPIIERFKRLCLQRRRRHFPQSWDQQNWSQGPGTPYLGTSSDCCIILLYSTGNLPSTFALANHCNRSKKFAWRLNMLVFIFLPIRHLAQMIVANMVQPSLMLANTSTFFRRNVGGRIQLIAWLLLTQGSNLFYSMWKILTIILIHRAILTTARDSLLEPSRPQCFNLWFTPRTVREQFCNGLLINLSPTGDFLGDVTIPC